MLEPATTIPAVLDVTTLFFVATCVTGLLGLLLLFAWARNRISALAWWGVAYLVGGLSVAAWAFERLVSPPLPIGIANALLFIAFGTMWNAARVFHGRPVLASALIGGAAVWLFACTFTDFAQWPSMRIIIGSLIVASYTFMTAAELWRERRKSLRSGWLAIFTPMLHAAMFLFPIPLASLLPADSDTVILLKRMGGAIRAGDDALRGRYSVYRTGAGNRADASHPHGRGLDRRIDGAAQPARGAAGRPRTDRAASAEGGGDKRAHV